jgi:hypothetical protein
MLLPLACGGPSLDLAIARSAAFGASADCSQGPLTLAAQAIGAKWGEGVALIVKSPRGVAFHVDVKIGSNETKWSWGGARDNQRCVFAADGAPGPTGATSALPTTSGPTTSSARAVPSAAVIGSGPAPTFVAKPAVPDGGDVAFELAIAVDPFNAPNAFTIDGLSRGALTQVATTPLVAGTPISLTVWSEAPNDLRDVTFTLTQYTLTPPKPDAEWSAYLKHKLDEARADASKRASEAKIETAGRVADDAARREADVTLRAKCVDDEWSGDCARIRAEARAKADAAHEAFCAAPEHLPTIDCDVVRDRLDAEARAAAAPPPNPADAAKLARWCAIEAHHGQPACAPPAPTKPADRPPPPPQIEEKPPKPSDNAEWIPGMWVWDGADYRWTSGGWRVPDEDRIAKKTPTAPAPPPPDRVETIPVQPVAGAVWVPGYWHWEGKDWVWVPGRWRMPPPAAPHWRKPVWVIDGGRVRLEPGGFVP